MGRTLLGAVTTIVWLAIVATTLVLRSSELRAMTLDQWGTFLGGVTGPVAFLWLILGYLQQGDELRLNTNALRLQQEELKRQVTETAALVRQSELQAKAAMDSVELERERVRTAKSEATRQAQPLFVWLGSTVQSGARAEHTYQNHGGVVRDVTARMLGDQGSVRLSPADAVLSGRQGTLVVEGVTNYPAQAELAYTDQYGARRAVRLTMAAPGAFRQEPLVIDPDS